MTPNFRMMFLHYYPLSHPQHTPPIHFFLFFLSSLLFSSLFFSYPHNLSLSVDTAPLSGHRSGHMPPPTSCYPFSLSHLLFHCCPILTLASSMAASPPTIGPSPSLDTSHHATNIESAAHGYSSSSLSIHYVPPLIDRVAFFSIIGLND